MKDIETLLLVLRSCCGCGGWWVYLDYSVSSSAFLSFSLRFEFHSEISVHSVCETRDPSLTICFIEKNHLFSIIFLALPKNIQHHLFSSGNFSKDMLILLFVTWYLRISVGFCQQNFVSCCCLRRSSLSK